VSTSRNALSLSSACTTKRFPSPRCASAIQIVRPLESIAETQPQLQPALLRLSAMISKGLQLPAALRITKTNARNAEGIGSPQAPALRMNNKQAAQDAGVSKQVDELSTISVEALFQTLGTTR